MCKCVKAACWGWESLLITFYFTHWDRVFQLTPELTSVTILASHLARRLLCLPSVRTTGRCFNECLPSFRDHPTNNYSLPTLCCMLNPLSLAKLMHHWMAKQILKTWIKMTPIFPFGIFKSLWIEKEKDVFTEFSSQELYRWLWALSYALAYIVSYHVGQWFSSRIPIYKIPLVWFWVQTLCQTYSALF